LARLTRYSSDHGQVVAHRVPEDVHNDLALGIAPQGRQFPLQEIFHAHILQPDRIQHPGCCLDNARGMVACHRQQADPLGDQRADPLQRNNLFELDAVSERPAGCDYWIRQFQTGQPDCHVRFHGPLSSFQV
jgi:hypothetical protein